MFLGFHDNFRLPVLINFVLIKKNEYSFYETLKNSELPPGPSKWPTEFGMGLSP